MKNTLYDAQIDMDVLSLKRMVRQLMFSATVSSRIITLALAILCAYLCFQFYLFFKHPSQAAPNSVKPSTTALPSQAIIDVISTEKIISANLFGVVKHNEMPQKVTPSPPVRRKRIELEVLGIVSSVENPNVAILQYRGKQGVFLEGQSLLPLGHRNIVLTAVSEDAITVKQNGETDTYPFNVQQKSTGLVKSSELASANRLLEHTTNERIGLTRFEGSQIGLHPVKP